VSTPWVRFFFWIYLLFLVWADATVTNPADPDLWHRLALGETLLKTGHFPTGDTFSYLADYQKIADHEWGSAIIIYALYHWAGTSTFVGMKLITLAITLALIVWAGLWRRRPSALIAAFYALVLLALLPSFQSTVRCMTFTHIFFALWLYWFQVERHGRSIPTLFYVLTMIVWANLHGGFVIGLGWLLVVALVEASFQGPWRKWLVRFGACSLVTLINPFGWNLWVSTGRALVVTRHEFQEWAPVPLTSWWSDPPSYLGYKLLLPLTLAFLVMQIYREGWKRIDRPIFILLGFFITLSLTSARQTSFLALGAGALLPGILPRERPLQAITDPLFHFSHMALRSTLLLLPFF